MVWIGGRAGMDGTAWNLDFCLHVAAFNDRAHTRRRIYSRPHIRRRLNPMPQVTYIEPDGRVRTLEVDAGSSVMRAAVDAGIDGIEAQCGGNCACATCHCYVQEPWLDKLKPPSDDEALMLNNVAAERRPNSRLSCQVIVEPALDGLTVELPERQS
jgi:ferredoxin, 2Fe-2S